MSIRKRGNRYWYRFMWKGQWIEKSTRQGNAKIARQIEAAHKTALAKGEVGLFEQQPTPTLKDFCEDSFLPYIAVTFAKKPKTREYYEYGAKCLLGFEPLANKQLDHITNETIGKYVASRQALGNKVTTINRQLQVLRRMFNLAMNWKKVETRLEVVRMLPGERRRDRVLTPAEEVLYLSAARSSVMQKHSDPALLGDIDTILIDCGLRPEECFRLMPANLVDGAIEVHYGKTDSARRRIPMTPRVRAILDMRVERCCGSEWLFPAHTKSAHVEKSSLRKQHRTAVMEATRLLREQTGIETAQFQNFDLYCLRHTCLTRWAPHMDPWTLMRLAGHRDMATTTRYVHPEDETTQEAMKRAREFADRRAQEALDGARKVIVPSENRDKFRDTSPQGPHGSSASKEIN